MTSVSIPAAVTAQAMTVAVGPAETAMFWGMLKMPAPTIMANTSADSPTYPSLTSGVVALSLLFSEINNVKMPEKYISDLKPQT